MEKISRPDDCLRSCLHQIRNKALLLSWLPVVCPVGRPTAGYRTPAAPTRYLSARNKLIDGDDVGDSPLSCGEALGWISHPPRTTGVILAPRDTNYNVQRPEGEVDDHECAKRCSVMMMFCRCKVAQYLKHNRTQAVNIQNRYPARASIGAGLAKQRRLRNACEMAPCLSDLAAVAIFVPTNRDDDEDDCVS